MRTLLTLVLLAVAVRLYKPPMCLDWGGYGPYDNGPDDWGYMDWWCELPRGHSGDHWGSSL